MRNRRSQRQGVDPDLRRSIDAWAEVPEIANEIDGWDAVDRSDYLHEWTIEEDRLARVRTRVRSGELEQDEDYFELERLVEENRPIIEGLFEQYFG